MLVISGAFTSINLFEQAQAEIEQPITNPLNLDYIWQQTELLADIIDEYPPNLIPKGRAFGSWGGQDAAKLLKLEMDKPYIDLDNTKLEEIEPIGNTYYNRLLNVTDFQLQVHKWI